MIRFSGASSKEKSLIKKVEKACFKHLRQRNFFMIDLTVVDEETIHALNREARGVDRVTDVLSFPSFDRLSLPVKKKDFRIEDMDGSRVFLGSVMICRKRAEEQAEEFGHSFERELGFLACHGFLHILGFDHIEPDDEKIMIGHQKSVMDKVGLKRQ